MDRAVLQACLPWLVLLGVLTGCLWLLVRCNSWRWAPCRVSHLHRDQDGSAQSLSFVLSLPLFLMIILFIVQVSQLMIGTIVVHYAAFAAARNAVVWIPARLASGELENCVGRYYLDPDEPNQVEPVATGPSDGGKTYLVEPGSRKYQKISTAAAMACMPISPSRDLGLSSGEQVVAVIAKAYHQMVPGSRDNARIARRLGNKLAYALEQTAIEIQFRHENDEPPLVTYYQEDDLGEFYPGEIGWQDQITVTVHHNLALLPGPGRLLARLAGNPDGSPDVVSQRVQQVDGVYVYPLTASATLGNEGEKSVIPYVH